MSATYVNHVLVGVSGFQWDRGFAGRHYHGLLGAKRGNSAIIFLVAYSAPTVYSGSQLVDLWLLGLWYGLRHMPNYLQCTYLLSYDWQVLMTEFSCSCAWYYLLRENSFFFRQAILKLSACGELNICTAGLEAVLPEHIRLCRLKSVKTQLNYGIKSEN
jgi:hypothetical protein